MLLYLVTFYYYMLLLDIIFIDKTLHIFNLFDYYWNINTKDMDLVFILKMRTKFFLPCILFLCTAIYVTK